MDKSWYPVIAYVGDDTGWTPPNGKNTVEVPCRCSNSNENNDTKKVYIEYLYLDMKVCERCIGTDDILESVLEVLTPALKLAGYTVELKKIEIATPKLAEQYKFLSSPTIRINGINICKIEENYCDCCSDISGSLVDCRVFRYEGEVYEQPPKKMIAKAILQSVFLEKTEDCNFHKYILPENLKNFFDGKTKSSCDCGGACC